MANGFKYGGYKGQMLRVNLTRKKAGTEPLREDWARDFVGGVGYSARLLYEELPAKADPLGHFMRSLFQFAYPCLQFLVCLLQLRLGLFVLCDVACNALNRDRLASPE